MAGVRSAIPRMLYGTAWKEDKTCKLVKEALTVGFRGIDTAGQRAHYNQRGVGAGIKQWLDSTPSASRSDLFIQTKYSPGQTGEAEMPYDPNSSLFDQVQQSAKNSLEELQTDYIDSYILHSPVPSYSGNLEIWRSLEELVQKNIVKFIGLSNFYQPHIVQLLYQDAIIKPSIIQNRYYRGTGFDKDIRKFCDTSGIVYQSFWTITANTSVLPMIYPEDEQKSIQTFYRFVIQEGIIPLNGTTSIGHMKDGLSVLDMPPLEPELYQRIKSLLYGE